jgi:hypothetical protein
MMTRFAKTVAPLALLGGLWWMDASRGVSDGPWVRPKGSSAPQVRILQFYTSAGVVSAGQSAQLCYGVENARTIRISPMLSGVYTSPSRCIEVVPSHTTHYTILAEGYDGAVATRSLTLPVKTEPLPPPKSVYIAMSEERTAEPQAAIGLSRQSP